MAKCRICKHIKYCDVLSNPITLKCELWIKPYWTIPYCKNEDNPDLNKDINCPHFEEGECGYLTW